MYVTPPPDSTSCVNLVSLPTVNVARNTLHEESLSLPIDSSSSAYGLPRPVTGPASLNLYPVPANSLGELFTRCSEDFELSSFLKPVQHSAKLHIKTTGPPVCGRTLRLSPEKL